jgi:exopolyphosphatase/guanosine-5'-triphosphate,3'-diphosphate pyrophosphatase
LLTEEPLASIDLGTNSARLLIGTVDSGRNIRSLVVKKEITRLGGGFTRQTGLSPEARARTLAVLRDFATEIENHRVVGIRAVATSAVRDAVNGQAFVEEVFRETGIRLRVIDGREEAMLNLRGVVAGLGLQGESLVFDIGGGSTEYTLARGDMPSFTLSLPLGVVRLTEGKDDVAAMEEKVNRELEALRVQLLSVVPGWCPADTTLVGTAGTPATLAAVHLKLSDFDYRRVHGHSLSLEAIRTICDTLLPLTPGQRLTVAGIEKGREDLVAAGILITVRTMEMFGFERMTVCDTGLLEGLLLAPSDEDSSV